MAKQPEKPEEGKMSVFDQIKALAEQKAALVEQARAAAIEQVDAGIAELKLLGFDFVLAPADMKPVRIVNRSPKDAPCPICAFKTNPPHDKRAHKGHAAAFTAEEIAAKGWQVVQ